MTLAPGAQYRAEAGSVLGLPADVFTTGALVVESSVSGIVGDVAIGDSDSPILRQTSLALTSAPAKSLVIPYVVNGNGLGMSVSIMNAGPGKSAAQVKVIASDGRVVGATALTILPGGVASQALSKLIAAAAGQTSGAILIDGDQPLAAAAIVAPDTSLGDLAAIGAQPR
jgi:hypothetical protein